MKFTLFYPVKPFFVTQQFGVNGAYYQSHGINIQGHNGLDLRAAHGQPVYAAHDGIAYFQNDDSGGEGVILITNDTYDYKGKKVYFKSIYWHLADYGKELKLKSPVLDYQQKHHAKPMPIKRGDIVGYADNTGLSTGDHLHFGLKPIVPGISHPELDAVDIVNWANVEQPNGYLGAIDATPYFTGNYAQDKEELSPADQVAVIAATEEGKGNKTLADRLWAVVALIRSFLPL